MIEAAAASVPICALCTDALPPGATARVNGHLVCPRCQAQVERELAAQSTTAATMLPAAALGLLGAFVGALVWTVVAVATNMAIGIIAVLVGYLAGMGVKLGAGKARGQALQILAAALAVVGLVAAKYMIVAYYVVRNAGVGVSYLDPRIFTIFADTIGKLVSPFDILWVVIAVGAAYRVPKSKHVSIER